MDTNMAIDSSLSPFILMQQHCTVWLQRTRCEHYPIVPLLTLRSDGSTASLYSGVLLVFGKTTFFLRANRESIQQPYQVLTGWRNRSKKSVYNRRARVCPHAYARHEKQCGVESLGCLHRSEVSSSHCLNPQGAALTLCLTRALKRSL